MIANILILAILAWIFSNGYTDHFNEKLEQKDIEYNELIEETGKAYKLMSNELADAELRNKKLTYTLHQQRLEIETLKMELE